MALEINRLTYALGAKVRGVDLRDPLDTDTVAQIRSAWLEHQVLVFPDTDITPEQQLQFSAYFAPLEDYPLVHYRLDGYPKIFLLSNRDSQGRPSETRNAARHWHSDLSFTNRSINLHVHPLVPLDGRGGVLALAPPFPLHSRHDENILRVCSQRRPEIYDLTSPEKAAEMRDTLRVASAHYRPDGPIKLPAPLPDIDLLMADEVSSTLVIAELKWLRKTLRPAEIPGREAELLKGIGQLESIRQFLAEQPSHLARQRRLPNAVSEYEHVHYLLVARDYWRWVEPQDGIAIVDHDALARALARSESLHGTVSDLLTHDWLPVEGRDFRVQYDRATANGVAIESQVFYSTAPA